MKFYHKQSESKFELELLYGSQTEYIFFKLFVSAGGVGYADERYSKHALMLTSVSGHNGFVSEGCLHSSPRKTSFIDLRRFPLSAVPRPTEMRLTG